MMTYLQLLNFGKQVLAEENILEADLDAWYLLEAVCQIDRSYYFLHMQEVVALENVTLYKEYIKKRAMHIPIQQITHVAYFYGLSFYVNEHVLIPRHDTEVLVDEVLKLLKPRMQILDMCTGSGCILLSLLKSAKEITGVGVDISKEALAVANENAKRLQIHTTFLESNLFEKVSGTYDLIVSNPPYIKTKVIETLDEEVKNHEPMLALDGEQDGLAFYRRIIQEGIRYLNPQGYLCFEIGHDQAEEVCELLKESYTQIQVIKDLAGLDRVILARICKTI